MKISDLLKFATHELKIVTSKKSALEARLILSHILQCRPEEVIQRDNEEVSFQNEKKIRELIERRQKYEPMAHLLGKKEFFGLEFEVSRDVLIPRPESEALIEEVLRWTNSRGLTKGSVLDLGTGSGCLAIALGRHLAPTFEIFGMDLSAKALEVAKRNAARHQMHEINWLKADLRQDPFGTWTIIISNPPYIPTAELEDLQPDIRYYEPALALDGGEDGLAYLKTILELWPSHLAVPGLLAVETHGPKQVEALRSMTLKKKEGRAWSIGPHFFYEADPSP